MGINPQQLFFAFILLAPLYLNSKITAQIVSPKNAKAFTDAPMFFFRLHSS
jgi:hypothetical protein